MNLKDYEGKNVYLLPTGNNTRYVQNGVIAYLAKVAKVNATLRIGGEDGYDRKMRFSGNRLDDGCNSGWIVFESQQGLDDYKEVQKLSRIISDHCVWSSRLHKVELDKLREVVGLLGIVGC